MLSLQGMKMDTLEKGSVIVSMISQVFNEGSFTMKSRAIDEQGRVYMSDNMGYRGGFGFVGLFLWDWHRAQPLMYSVIVCVMFGHQ